MIFHKIIFFLAINKLRLSTYICTPSGIPKLKLWLSLLIPKLFSYSLIDKVKTQDRKKKIYKTINSMQKNIYLFATDKLNHSEYTRTPSDSVCPFQIFFFLPQTNKVKAQITKIYVNNIVDKPWIGLG